jgi:hypothetical protein
MSRCVDPSLGFVAVHAWFCLYPGPVLISPLQTGERADLGREFLCPWPGSPFRAESFFALKLLSSSVLRLHFFSHVDLIGRRPPRQWKQTLFVSFSWCHSIPCWWIRVLA